MYPTLMAEIARKGWGQKDLAEATGMTQSAVSLLMRGKKRVTVDVAFQIQEALGTPKTIDELFRWRDR